MINSFIKLYWRNCYNVSKLLKVVIKLTLDTNDDPYRTTYGHNKKFKPNDPHHVVVVLVGIRIRCIFWLKEARNPYCNCPTVQPEQVVNDGDVVEPGRVLHLVAQESIVFASAVEQAPIIIQVPVILICTT